MHLADPQTVYIVAGDAALSHSVRFLLETHMFLVKTVAVSEKTLKKLPMREQDIIMLDLDGQQSVPYRLLDQLMHKAKRPGIVLTTALKSALKPGDIFPGDRIKLLFHPVTPKSLLEVLSQVSVPADTQGASRTQ